MRKSKSLALSFLLACARRFGDRPSHFYLKEMCIAGDRQRQGLGTRLLEYLSAELETRDTRRIYLLTARGDMSEAFYAKAGFYTSLKMILMARRFENGTGS